ncbi:hypothetical protein WUBG_06262 [Wuchereria bancrofti]|uniref:Uncharacterized protein n=1 Tax=Wuchereria bancrofti TaxID=6293 RepID=J9F047_WUCBA|nr:hypothetical protein WUBG_06262 [Wuchereria bancrofti]
MSHVSTSVVTVDNVFNVIRTVQSLSNAIEFNAIRRVDNVTYLFTVSKTNVQRHEASKFVMIKVRLGSEAVTVSIEWPQWKQHVGSSFEHLTDAYSFCCQPLVVRRCSVSDLFQPLPSLPCPYSTTVLVSRGADGHPSSKQQHSLLSQHIHSLRRPQQQQQQQRRHSNFAFFKSIRCKDAERMLPSTMSPFPFTSVTNQGYPGSSCHVRAMGAEHTMI